MGILDHSTIFMEFLIDCLLGHCVYLVDRVWLCIIELGEKYKCVDTETCTLRKGSYIVYIRFMGD
jgi:hypothetical protein